MNFMHNNRVNNIAEYNVLHGILNYSKRTKNISSHYYLILHGFMNTHRVNAKFKIIESYWIVYLVP